MIEGLEGLGVRGFRALILSFEGLSPNRACASLKPVLFRVWALGIGPWGFSAKGFSDSSEGALGGSWVVISGVIIRVTDDPYSGTYNPTFDNNYP